MASEDAPLVPGRRPRGRVARWRQRLPVPTNDGMK